MTRPRTASELFDLTGQTAMISGGATGIGRQMSFALAEAGANVVVCARDGDRCREAADELSALGVDAIGLTCDVSDPDSVNATVETAHRRFGRIDILVNNAGTTWGAPAERHPLDRWQKVLDVNLTGAFHCAQAVGRLMLRAGRGKVINIASVAALRGSPSDIRQTAAYSASKGGLVALTRDLACEWGPRGVNVNALAPGWFPTQMAGATLEQTKDRILAGVPLGRVGGEDDLKGAVLFLAAPASDYVTGQVIVVDGGRTAW